MPSPDPFLTRLLTCLASLGPVRPRAMFGGHGLYLAGDHIAIVDGRRLYFRVDPDSDTAPDRNDILPYAERAVAAARAQRRGSAGKVAGTRMTNRMVRG